MTASESDLALFGGPPAVPQPLPWWTPLSDEELDAATRVLRDVPLTTLWGDHEVGAFEREFEERFGCAHAIAVTSGTSALHAAILAAEIGPGDEVIVTPFSFVASVSVVVLAGATPVFVDIELDSLAIDPREVAAHITSRTRAILPVHHSGYPADMEALTRIATEHELFLIEDCAGAPGARIGERTVGSIGDFGCFSFNIGKILRTGEGGMVTTQTEEAARRLREIRVNGLTPSPHGSIARSLGSNFTMPQVMAAIGRVQLRHLDEMLAARERNAGVIIEAIAALSEARTPASTPERERVFYELPIFLADGLVPHRDLLVEALRAENVPAGAGRRQPLYEVEHIRSVARVGPCPRAEDRCRSTMFIDPRSMYTREQAEQIGAGLTKVFQAVEQVVAGARRREEAA